MLRLTWIKGQQRPGIRAAQCCSNASIEGLSPRIMGSG